MVEGGGACGACFRRREALPSESDDGLLMSGQITRCPDGRTLCPENSEYYGHFVGLSWTFL